MCMLDYGEPVQQSRIFTYVMRRTDAHCHECGRPIAPGETYTHGQWNEEHPHYRDVDDLDLIGTPHLDTSYRLPQADDWMTLRQCQHCSAAATWLTHACSGFLYGAVGEDLWEHVRGEEYDERTPELTRLYRWMQAKWCKRDGSLRTVDEVRAQAQLAMAAHDRRHAALAATAGSAA